MIKVFGVSLTIFFLAIKVTFAGTISGVVTDKYTHETIIGATVRISGTTLGTITSSEGYFEINDLKDGSYNLEVRCVSYKTIISDTIIINSNDIFFVDFQMESDDKILEAVVITARINRENEITLMKERQNSSVAVESIWGERDEC
jgi:hypothetical protein